MKFIVFNPNSASQYFVVNLRKLIFEIFSRLWSKYLYKKINFLGRKCLSFFTIFFIKL